MNLQYVLNRLTAIGTKKDQFLYFYYFRYKSRFYLLFVVFFCLCMNYYVLFKLTACFRLFYSISGAVRSQENKVMERRKAEKSRGVKDRWDFGYFWLFLSYNLWIFFAFLSKILSNSSIETIFSFVVVLLCCWCCCLFVWS